jgi:hypothetical protein
MTRPWPSQGCFTRTNSGHPAEPRLRQVYLHPQERERRMPRGIRDGRRLTDQTIILDREWLARCRAVRVDRDQ